MKDNGEDSARDEYFLSIEAHFAKLRETPFVLSAKDWALMKEWFEEGIPLPIVLEALESAFEKKEAAGRRGEISSLSYCRGPVRSLWRERREMRVGADESVPEIDPAEKLSDLVAALELAAGKAEADLGAPLEEAAAEIRALKRASTPRMEESLIEIETRLHAALIEGLPKTLREELDSAVGSQLAGISFSDEEAEERTQRSTMIRELRRRFDIPRLSLFD